MRRPGRVRLQASAGAAEETELQAARSLGEVVRRVQRAVWQGNRTRTQEWAPREVYGDHVIVEMEDGLRTLRVPYTLGEDGSVTFGEVEEVQTEYVPVAIASQQAVTASELVASETDAEGLEWEVDIIREGLSLARVTQGGKSLPVVFTASYLESLVPLLEGVRVYALDDTASGHKASAALKRQEQLAGWISDVKLVGSRVVGRLHFNPAGVGLEKAQVLAAAWKKGKRDLFGLSIDSRGVGRVGVQAGKQVYIAEEAKECDSVDVVVRPAAGGGFTALAASAEAAEHNQDGEMRIKKNRLWAAIQASRPDVLSGRTEATATEKELLELASAEELRAAIARETAEETTATAVLDPAAIARQVHLRASEFRAMEQVITESKLPGKTQSRLRRLLDDPEVTTEQVQAAVDEARGELAAATPTPVSGFGIGREGLGSASVGAEPIDKLQAGFDRMMGLEPENPELKTVAPLGIRKLYEIVTLGLDPNVSGTLQASEYAQIQAADFNNASLPTVVGNTFNRVLAREYGVVDYGLGHFVTYRPGGVKDFKKVTTIRLGGFGNLPTVDPEVADYAELAKYGEDPIEYQVGQRGGLVTITRKHIINDDVGHVARLTKKLGRAAGRTFAKFCWDLILSNPVIYDGKALFHADHGNLITTAFGSAALNAMEQALYLQKEDDSNEVLGLTPHVLAVPIQLKPTAVNLNQKGSADSDNEWQHRFGEGNERVIVSPFMTDANDYFVFGNPAEVDVVEVAFLNDQREPEFFLADNPSVGQMLAADKLVWKIRHEYGGTNLDYRGVQKAAVP